MSGESSRLEFLGQLAGGLAHEIKNPLSTMRLHLELMEEELQEDDSKRGQRMYGKVNLLLKEIRRLDDILQEFLRVSRGHDLKLAAVELTRSLEELVELVRPEAEKHNVSLHLRILGKLGTVLIDESYFHGALLNLVQNAIQACIPKGGGSVIVEAGRASSFVGITIVDTGVGIPDEQRDRVFRAWFTSRPGGTGMGLPIAKRIIDEHGGYISFDSVPGQGTRFMVALPVGGGESLSQVVVHPEAGGARPLAPREAIDVEAVVNQVLADSRERT